MPRLEVKAPILVVAGDLSTHQFVRKELIDLAERWEHVLFVPGNHEYYGNTLELFDYMELPGNVHLLNRANVLIEDVTFIGATLWTDFCGDPMAQFAAARGIADFRAIRNFSPAQCAELHRKHRQYLKFAYEHTEGKRVIITHFLPSPRCTHPRYGTTNLLNKYFAPDLTEWIESLEDTTWLFGHTHDRMQLQIGNTKLYANPRGYPNENEQPYEALGIEV